MKKNFESASLIFGNFTYKYGKLIIVCLFAALVIIQANKHFVLDEIDFPIVSHATSQTLKPEYYRGEESPVHVGTYHPTLYINSLAAFIKIFGYSEISVRLFGLLCTILSAYLLIQILRRLIGRNQTAEILFLALYLFNPYTIANTTLPDIDSTVLPILILLFINVSLKYILTLKNTSNHVVLILGLLFALALWSKLTTPLILPIFLLCLTNIVTKDLRRSAVFCLKVTLLGVIVFTTSYYIYCLLLNLSPTYTYTFLIESFTKGTSSEGAIQGAVSNLSYGKYFVFWPTIPLVLLFAVSFMGTMLNKSNLVEVKIQKLLAVMSLIVTVFYLALIAPFGGFFKYPFPLFGILIMTIVFFWVTYFGKSKIKYLPLKLATGFILGFAINKLFWEDEMFINRKPFEGLFLAAIVAVLFYGLLKFQRTKRYTAILYVFVVSFCIGFQFSLSRVQATSAYSTKYLYGQSGSEQATDYLKASTAPGEAIWSMKDIGYYVNNKYYESYTYYFDTSMEAELIKMLDDGKVRYYVTTTGIGQDNSDYYKRIKMILDLHAEKDRQFGNFIIYKAKDTKSNANK